MTRQKYWCILGCILSLMIENATGVSCVGQVLGATDPSNITTNIDTTAGSAYIQTGANLIIPCCGIASGWRFYSKSTGTVKFHVYRSAGGASYEVLGEHEVTGVTADNDYRIGSDPISVEPGDLFGWSSGNVIIPYVDTTGANDGIFTQVTSPAAGGSVTWAGAPENNRKYAVGIEVSASSPPSFIQPADGDTVTIPESTPVNDVVQTILTTDPDTDDIANLVVSMVSTSSYFNIAQVTPGEDVLQVSATLSPGLYPLVIQVQDTCGEAVTLSFNVEVTDDIPEITNLPFAAEIDEHTRETETEKLLRTLTIADNSPAGDLTCSMTGDPSVDPFVCKLVDGSTDLGIYWSYDPANLLDYDTINLYRLNVTVNDGTSNSVIKKFEVDVLKNNDPTFDALPTSTDVPADTTDNGTIVYTVAASDTDGGQLSYSMTCTCPFEMDLTGKIRSIQNLNDHKETPYTATVTVSDTYNTVTSTLILNVININCPPNITWPTDPLPRYDLASVAENTGIGAVVDTVVAIDVDGDALTYRGVWNPGAGADLFQIESDGRITTKVDLNYEELCRTTGTTYEVELEVCDNRACSQKAGLSIDVTDVNEAPTFLKDFYSVSTTEGSASATIDCAFFNVDDPDKFDITNYAVVCNPAGKFHVTGTSAACSAVIQMSEEYDLDTPGAATDTVTCTVSVTDKEGLTDSATLEITVHEINDNRPVFAQASYTYTLTNNTAPFSFFGDIDTTDLDFLPQHKEHSYTSSKPSLFDIDHTGQLFNKIDLRNVMAPTSYTFTVTAEDNGGLTASVPVTVNVIDVPPTTTTTAAATVIPQVYQDILKFTDEKANLAWLIPCLILAAIAAALLGYMIYRCLTTPGACNACYRCCRTSGQGNIGKIGHGNKRVADSNRKKPNRSRSNLCDCFERKGRARDLEDPGHGPWEPWKQSDFKTLKKWVG